MGAQWCVTPIGEMCRHCKKGSLALLCHGFRVLALAVYISLVPSVIGPPCFWPIDLAVAQIKQPYRVNGPVLLCGVLDIIYLNPRLNLFHDDLRQATRLSRWLTE